MRNKTSYIHQQSWELWGSDRLQENLFRLPRISLKNVHILIQRCFCFSRSAWIFRSQPIYLEEQAVVFPDNGNQTCGEARHSGMQNKAQLIQSTLFFTWHLVLGAASSQCDFILAQDKKGRIKLKKKKLQTICKCIKIYSGRGMKFWQQQQEVAKYINNKWF